MELLAPQSVRSGVAHFFEYLEGKQTEVSKRRADWSQFQIDLARASTALSELFRADLKSEGSMRMGSARKTLDRSTSKSR